VVVCAGEVRGRGGEGILKGGRSQRRRRGGSRRGVVEWREERGEMPGPRGVFFFSFSPFRSRDDAEVVVVCRWGAAGVEGRVIWGGWLKRLKALRIGEIRVSPVNSRRWLGRSVICFFSPF
jgi:hypothetical protein